MLVTQPDALFMQTFDVIIEELEKTDVYEIPPELGNAYVSNFKKEGDHMERNKFDHLDLVQIGLKNMLSEQEKEFKKAMTIIENTTQQIDDIGNACKQLNDFAETVDGVNHPSHYQSQSGLEAIDVIEAFKMNFNLGNVLKYIVRAERKGQLQDLKKALWYLQREIQNQEEGTEE